MNHSIVRITYILNQKSQSRLPIVVGIQCIQRFRFLLYDMILLNGTHTRLN